MIIEAVTAGLWADLTGVPADPAPDAVEITGRSDPALPSIFRIGTAATACVATATLSAAVLGAERTAGFGAAPAPVRVEVREAVTAFRSERYLRLDGRQGTLWDELSGDYPTSDGWIRLHCNFPHHARAACEALGAAPERAALTAALHDRLSVDAEQSVIDAGGAAGALRTAGEWAEHEQSAATAARPVVSVSAIDEVADLAVTRSRRSRRPVRSGPPLAGLRVLDLTRVIAGPVAGRVLASWGADVLAVRAPHLPTVAWTDLDTGFGKRLSVLDLRATDGRETMADLIRHADVVLQSYRPGALARLGLGPRDVARLHPGIGYVSVSAYGDTGPWGGRRGFDSLVQMVTGVADAGMRAAGADRPVPLPAQALDHAAGWLAAAAAVETVRRAWRDGGSWQAEVTLAGVAHWLTGLGDIDNEVAAAVPDPTLDDVTDLIAAMPLPDGGELRYVRPPGRIGEATPSWSSPPPFPVHRP